jgi:hypothetical protein
MTDPQRCFRQMYASFRRHNYKHGAVTCACRWKQVVSMEITHKLLIMNCLIYMFYFLFLLLIFFGQNSPFCVCYEHFMFVPFLGSIYLLSRDSDRVRAERPRVLSSSPGRERISVSQVIQTGYGAHPSSYRELQRGAKATGA